MTIEQLRRVINMQPFEPFVVDMADGREVSVQYPELIAISP